MGTVRFVQGNDNILSKYVTQVNSTYARMEKPVTSKDYNNTHYQCADDDETNLIASVQMYTECKFWCVVCVLCVCMFVCSVCVCVFVCSVYVLWVCVCLCFSACIYACVGVYCLCVSVCVLSVCVLSVCVLSVCVSLCVF